jgi:hypothetical protein
MQLAPFWATFSQAHLVTVPLSHAAARSIVILAIFRAGAKQCCQIFLGTTYQNGEKFNK